MKEYSFNLNEVYLEKFFPNERVKSKAQIIEILMEAIKYMLLNPSVEADKVNGRIILRIDDMSRLIFVKNEKYFSIVFPFFVFVNEDGYSFRFKNLIEIDSSLTSQVISIIKCDEFKANCSVDFFIPICEYEENCDDNFWVFLKELLLMEDGYIRYDYDEDNYKKFKKVRQEHRHPLNHYDLFYSSNATFKIGLTNIVTEKEFIDFLDVKTNCKYLTDPHEKLAEIKSDKIMQLKKD